MSDVGEREKQGEKQATEKGDKQVWRARIHNISRKKTISSCRKMHSRNRNNRDDDEDDSDTLMATQVRHRRPRFGLALVLLQTLTVLLAQSAGCFFGAYCFGLLGHIVAGHMGGRILGVSGGILVGFWSMEKCGGLIRDCLFASRHSTQERRLRQHNLMEGVATTREQLRSVPV